MKFQVHLQAFVLGRAKRHKCRAGQQPSLGEYLRSDTLQDGQSFRHLHLQRETVVHRSVRPALTLIHTVSVIARHHSIQRRLHLVDQLHTVLDLWSSLLTLGIAHASMALLSLNRSLPYAYRLRRHLLIERSTCGAA